MKVSLLISASREHGHLTYIDELLKDLDSVTTNHAEELEWKISGFTIKFSQLNNLKLEYPAWNAELAFDIVHFAKIILLASIQGGKSPNVIRYRFDSIVKTIYFLAKSNIQSISPESLDKYFEFMLMHGMQNGTLVTRMTPLSYRNLSIGVLPQDWSQLCRLLELPKFGFTSQITNSKIEKSLARCLDAISDGDLTFSDWKCGGSFNKLTLDYGQFYVEHCASFFDNHIGLAIALKKTLNEAAEIAEGAGLSVSKDSLKSYVLLTISHFLAGKLISDLTERSKARCSQKWLQKIYNFTISTFQKHYRSIKAIEYLKSEKNIIHLMRESGIDKNDVTKKEVIQNIACSYLEYLSSTNNQALQLLLSKDLDNLRSSELYLPITETIKKEYLNLIETIKIEMPTSAFFETIGIEERGSQSKFVLNFLRAVEDAGIIKFVALTGWRESEFGFSLDNINVTRNIDVLDQISVPSRFEIIWYIPKTHGSFKVEREITRELFFTATLLSKLVDVKKDDPCLYSYNHSAVNIKNSSEFIKETVGNLWPHFVQHYPPFIYIRWTKELNRLRTKDLLSDDESERLNLLTQICRKYDFEKYLNNHLLLTAYDRAIDEFDRVDFFLKADSRRKVVWKYRCGELKDNQRVLLDRHLSKETKSIIFTVKSSADISPMLTREIVNELVSDCLYPTPHAFRHMWAEAVYRRFDGDVGWMVRSNFKHISQNMWLAYIRDKDNRRLHEPVKRKVVSSILHNYIVKSGTGYAGATEKFLRRLFLNTHVTSIEDLRNKVDQFCLLEVEDIKSNPWGYCMLRKRGACNAKCAEEGIPQRHSASPTLCLGCSFNLTQQGHIGGILLGIVNDMNILKNHNIPSPYRRASYNTVKNALRHLIKLNADAEIVSELRNALKMDLA